MSAVRLERQHSLPQGQPVFHTGERRHVSTAGSLEPLCGTAAQGLRSAKHCFRDLLTALERLCRYTLSLAFCAENAALALLPSHCRMTMRRGGASLHTR